MWPYTVLEGTVGLKCLDTSQIQSRRNTASFMQPCTKIINLSSPDCSGYAAILALISASLGNSALCSTVWSRFTLSDYRAIVGTFIFSALQRQKLCVYCILCQGHFLKRTKLGSSTFQIWLCLFSETCILMNWTFVVHHEISRRNCNSVLMKDWYFSFPVNFFRDFCLICFLLNWDIFLVGDDSCLHS